MAQQVLHVGISKGVATLATSLHSIICSPVTILNGTEMKATFTDNIYLSWLILRTYSCSTFSDRTTLTPT